MVPVPFHPVLKLIGGDENRDSVTIYEFRVPPQSAGAPPHTHTMEDEYFYVVSGTASFLNGEDVIEAPAGSFAALTRGNLHAFWNSSDEEAVMVMMTVGGKFEEFFDEVAMRVQAEKPGSPEEMGALVGQAAAERGITIDMSKVPDTAKPLYGME
ncbi:cupin domain-containing protein [Parvularcula lutaonensis]|uniref:Cupin domain-containing protein n=1 Tax=Parvularcula lutaonensis TaxID=491923 RepID=A0ABV7MCC7_9PROT|nr:cupin domain-containing protein [Parvularcula lutaonensis]